MRTIVLLFATALSLCAGVHDGIQAVEPDWLYVSQPLRWETPPVEAELRTHSAPATLLVLYPNGDFGSVSCLLIKQSDGQIVMSAGDGFVVRFGTWKQASERVIVTARVVLRAVQISGVTEPESFQTEEYSLKQLEGQRHLQSSTGQNYERLPHFVDWKNLASLLNAGRIGVATR